jgi:hypothetical protein
MTAEFSLERASNIRKVETMDGIISLETTLAKPFGTMLKNSDRLFLLNQWEGLTRVEQETLLEKVDGMEYDRDACIFAGVDYSSLSPLRESSYTGREHLIASEIKDLLVRKKSITSQLSRPKLILPTVYRRALE